MAKGYWKAIGAKLLHVVDVTFCSIPTDGVNCRYLDCLTFGASVVQCKPAKKMGSVNGVPTTSPMIKFTKGWRRGRRKFARLELHTSLSWRVFLFYTRISP